MQWELGLYAKPVDFCSPYINVCKIAFLKRTEKVNRPLWLFVFVIKSGKQRENELVGHIEVEKLERKGWIDAFYCGNI